MVDPVLSPFDSLDRLQQTPDKQAQKMNVWMGG